MRSTTRFRGLARGLASALWLVPFPTWALPVIESVAEASSVETGEDPGTDFERRVENRVPFVGVTVEANTFRCVGTETCVRDPVWESGANARAITQFGFNSAQVYAFSGPNPSAQNDVVDSAAASSLWVDDWTFSVRFGGPLPPIEAVSVDIELDALWQNTGQLVFEAAIVDTTLPPIVDPDDPDPFLDLDGRVVSRVAFDSTAPFASTGVPPIRVPIPDGGEPDGDLLLPLTLSFVPELGRTYQIGARLVAIANGEADEELVPRGFATVRRIVLPHAWVHFDSAGRSSSLWNVVVPEPATAWLLALAGCALARRRAA